MRAGLRLVRRRWHEYNARRALPCAPCRGSLAQLVEHRAFNPLVLGSSPRRPTNISCSLRLRGPPPGRNLHGTNPQLVELRVQIRRGDPCGRPHRTYLLCLVTGRDNAARPLVASPSGPNPHRPRTPRLAAALRAAARRRLLGPSPTVPLFYASPFATAKACFESACRRGSARKSKAVIASALAPSSAA